MSVALSESERAGIRARTEAREVYWAEHDRGDYSCPRCSTDEAIEVHHRDGDPFNNDTSNLVGLCHQCHRAIHQRRNTEQRLDEMVQKFAGLGEDSDINSQAVEEESAPGEEVRA